MCLSYVAMFPLWLWEFRTLFNVAMSSSTVARRYPTCDRRVAKRRGVTERCSSFAVVMNVKAGRHADRKNPNGIPHHGPL